MIGSGVGAAGGTLTAGTGTAATAHVLPELLAAVQRRIGGPSPMPAWHLVVEALELTASAASADAGDPGSERAAELALLAGAAAREALRLLGGSAAGTGGVGGVGGVGDVGEVGDAGDADQEPAPPSFPAPVALLRVRRTSARLAVLVLDAGPVTSDQLVSGLEAHAQALQSWRGAFLANSRRASLDPVPSP